MTDYRPKASEYGWGHTRTNEKYRSCVIGEETERREKRRARYKRNRGTKKTGIDPEN